MPETITLHALDLSGETTLKLFLRKDDGTLLNTGGDALTEIGSSGVFTATLAESRSGLGDLSYRVCLATETSDNLLIDGFLPETETTIGASGTAVLDSSSVTAVQSGLATSASITALRGADNDTLKTLSDQIDGIDGGAGLTGPYTRTITVTDADTDATIENAKVRLYRTGETETKPTNASGVTSFTTEAATFSYAVTANGYGGASGTITISANGATTIELTATSVTAPTNPDLSAIEVLCLDEDFEAVAGVEVDFRMAAIPTGDQNRAYPGAKKTVTSNGSGIARFEGPEGATVEWKRGTGQQWTAVMLDNDSVTNVTSLIGSP